MKNLTCFMKQHLALLPFLITPILMPLYSILDGLLLVELFGCGCVPSTQRNIFNIPFNANDLRIVVFSGLLIGLTAWSTVIAERFARVIVRIVYCLAVFLLNFLFSLWYCNHHIWL